MSAPQVPSLILWGATGQAVVLHEFLCPEAYRLAAVFDNDPACQPPFAHAPLLIGETGLAAWLEMNDKAGAARQTSAWNQQMTEHKRFLAEPAGNIRVSKKDKTLATGMAAMRETV